MLDEIAGSDEWFVSFSQVELLLTLPRQTKMALEKLPPLLEPQSRVLIAGCGNSSLSSDIYDSGCHDVTSFDYSPSVINSMQV